MVTTNKESGWGTRTLGIGAPAIQLIDLISDVRKLGVHHLVYIGFGDSVTHLRMHPNVRQAVPGEARQTVACERHIRDEFPGVVIEPWDFQMDGLTAESGIVSNPTSAVIKYMKNIPPGKYTVADVSAALGFDTKQRNGLKDGLKKKRKVYLDLDTIGVSYVVEGQRKGAKSYLIKSA